jgi:hypothetical protein
MGKEKTFQHLDHPIIWYCPCDPLNQFFTIDLPPLDFVCLGFPYVLRRYVTRCVLITMIYQPLINPIHKVTSFQYFSVSIHTVGQSKPVTPIGI